MKWILGKECGGLSWLSWLSWLLRLWWDTPWLGQGECSKGAAEVIHHVIQGESAEDAAKIIHLALVE
jgi:hypothetical protein